MAPISMIAATMVGVILAFLGASFDTIFYPCLGILIVGGLCFGTGTIFAFWDGDMDSHDSN
jgi:hypothetical protein